MFNRIPYRLLKICLLGAFFMFSTNALEAQNFVPKNIALERIEVNLAEVDKDVVNGTLSLLDKQIATSYTEYMVELIEGNSTIEQAIQIGFDKTSQLYPLYPSLVANYKNKMTQLLLL